MQLKEVILDLTQKNKSIVGYGAPARATTLSAYIGLQFVKQHLRAVIDESPAKQRAFMPGTHLKIVSSKILSNKDPPDFVLLFAWPCVSDTLEKSMNYLQSGGSFIARSTCDKYRECYRFFWISLYKRRLLSFLQLFSILTQSARVYQFHISLLPVKKNEYQAK